MIRYRRLAPLRPHELVSSGKRGILGIPTRIQFNGTAELEALAVETLGPRSTTIPRRFGMCSKRLQSVRVSGPARQPCHLRHGFGAHAFAVLRPVRGHSAAVPSRLLVRYLQVSRLSSLECRNAYRESCFSAGLLSAQAFPSL
jgi:hypothetical protein